MVDEYDFLRSQYEAIIEQSKYLLAVSADPDVLAKANESKRRAEYGLTRLNRCRVSTVGSEVRING